MAVRRTWIGWCLLLGVMTSCATSNDTSGAGGAGGAAGSASGGRSGTGGVAGGKGGGGGSTGEGGAAGASAGNGGGQVVDTSGGSVNQAGVTLDVPASAVASPVMITIAPTTPPSGYTLASQAYEFGPSGTQFQQPVTVTIPLTAGTTGVHLFWSNDSGGFDDVGGTITGSTLTAQVTHFSVGFCAAPKASSGSGGATATGGASGVGGSSGAAGAGTAGRGAAGSTGGGAGGSTSSGAGGSIGTGGSTTGAGGSTSGAGGSTSGAGGGTGAAGSSGTAGGPGTGAAGSSGAGGTSGATDAGLGPDAAASLCKIAALNLPGATVSYPEGGAVPDPSTYKGGTMSAGRFYLRAVTHYGGGTYTGATREQLTIDPVAQTMVYGAFLPTQQGSAYWVMTYAVVSSNTLRVTVQCSNTTSPTGTFDMYYTAPAVNATGIILTTAGATDVLTYY